MKEFYFVSNKNNELIVLELYPSKNDKGWNIEKVYIDEEGAMSIFKKKGIPIKGLRNELILTDYNRIIKAIFDPSFDSWS